MDRLERLVNLVVALLDTRRPLTREEIRQRVGGYSEGSENFHRNFERDKDLLRQMGIPLVAAPVDPLVPETGTGYRIPRSLYELPDPGLDADELMALSLAASAVALDGFGEGATTTALWKLAGAVRSTEAGSTEAGSTDARSTEAGSTEAGSPRGGPPSGPEADRLGPPGPRTTATAGRLADVPVDETVATLFSAVAERRAARFNYNGVPRRVDPYRLSYRQGRWYLAGFDHGRGGERLFRADRMSGPVQVEGPAGAFARPPGTVAGPPPPWRLGDDDEVLVELKVSAGQAAWVRSLAGEGTVAGVEPDGATRFRLPVTNRAALRSFVLGLLEHAEVVGPPDVRDEIVRWLSDIAADRPPVPRPPVRQPEPAA